jgi:amino acid adenylation domain-containing protein
VNPELSISPDQLAYILYTSGSTGAPKGVVHTHRNLLHDCRNRTNLFHISADDRCSLLSFGTGQAIKNIFTVLLNGAGLYPLNVKEEGAAHLPGWLIREEITVYESSASLFRSLCDALTGQEQFPRLRLIRLGSEAISRKDVELYRAHFSSDCILVNLLASVEAGSHRCYLIDKETPLTGDLVPVGHAVQDIEVLLLDDAGQDVGCNRVGEIVVRSRYLSPGYWRRPDLTKAAFQSSPDGGPERIYHTGDLGRMLPDGRLEYLGRKDFQAKIRGYGVEVGEVEMALVALDSVKAAVVTAREDASGQRCLVAYVVPSAAPGPTVQELRAALAPKVSDFAMPSAFVMMDALPVLPDGKVNRSALPVPGPDRPELETPLVPPRTPIEETLAEIWAEVLGVARVGIRDNFLELGGNSLQASRLAVRIIRAFGVELPLPSLYQAATVEEMAAIIAQHPAEQREPNDRGIPRTEQAGPSPLSFNQQQWWLLHQLQPDNPALNRANAIRIRGAPNLEVLQQVLDALIVRHEVLRTVFASVDGSPVQVVGVSRPVDLPLIDLCGWSEADVQRRMRAETHRPFDLSRDLMLRAVLFRLDVDEHVLLLTMHHITSDGSSKEVLFRELVALYEALSMGKPPALPELPIRYTDFARWQRQWLKDKVLDSQLGYWKQQLTDGPPVLELPIDRPRPAVPTYRGASESLVLPQSLVRTLTALGQQEQATLFMTLLAGFQTLLGRYTGRDDVAVGTPIAGRSRVETEPLIGVFVNTLVLRTDLSGNPTFRELLRRVRQVALGAYAHQDLPFARLVEELRPERTLTHNPLFQVMFVLQNMPRETLEMTGLILNRLEVESGAAMFDWTLTLRDGGDGLHATLEYDTDLFDAATIERLLGHYRTLLEGAVADPDRHLADLPLLTEGERQQILVEWNRTHTAYPRDRCVHQLFEAQVERTPDAVAVVFEEQRLTYRELNARANQLAHRLRCLGVGPDGLVGVCMERSPGLVVGLLGVLKAGGAYVPLDPEHPSERLAFMVSDAQPPVLLTQSSLLDRLPTPTVPVVCLDRDGPALALESTAAPSVSLAPDHLAYAIYTSGSTGRPKAALNTHQGICNRLLWMQQAYRLTPADCVLQKTPYSFDVSVWEFFWPLLAGVRLVLARPGGHRDPDYLVSLIETEQITICHFVPSMLRAFLEKPDLQPRCRSLREVFCSGEALSEDLQERFFAQISAGLHNLYGPTEASIDVSFWDCQRGSRGHIPIGRPVANTQLYVLDQRRRPVPVGVSGELYIGGVQLARGYHNRPELTAERFLPNPFASGRRLYRTGDRARWRPDGNLEFLGRLDDQVKLRGFRIELGEIGAALGQHPQVRQAVVLLREDRPGDKRLVAYVVPRGEARPTAAEFRRFLGQQLPEYMIPTAFLFLSDLPLTTNGKVDTRALPAPEMDRAEPADAFAEPRTRAEEVMAALWADALGVERVGIHDDFFALGGQSLLATLVISRVRATFGVELSLRVLFETPTVATLVEGIESALRSSALPAPTGNDERAARDAAGD